MKYIRNYNSFIKESKKEIEKNLLIVEKQILNTNHLLGNKF